MLRGLPHSFEETAVLLSSFHHIKDPCLYFLVCSGFTLRGAAAEKGPRGGRIVLVNILPVELFLPFWRVHLFMYVCTAVT